MKTIFLAALLCVATTKGAILQADLTGFPDNYRFYESINGGLIVTTQHSGHFLIDTETGDGVLTIVLEVIGGPSAGMFGGHGATYSGTVGIHMAPAEAGLLFGSIDTLPNQTDWWGGDMANSIHVDVDGCVQVGPFGVGCATHPMLAFYRHHNRRLLNYWVDLSTLSGIAAPAWSGDWVAEVHERPTETPTPEPAVVLPLAAGLLAIRLLRRYHWERA